MKGKLFLAVALAFCLAASLALGMLYLTENQWQMEQKRHALSIGVRQANQIEHNLTRSLTATSIMSSFLHQGGGRIEDFPGLCELMFKSRPAVSSFQLAPGGVIREIYPSEGNEKAIGHDLLADEKRSRETRLAVETRGLTLAGPFELLQGGVAVIGREPVFLREAGQERFWGFANVLIRMDDLLGASEIGHTLAEGYSYRLWRIHPDSGELQVFAASHEEEPVAPLEFSIQVPNAKWHLSISPLGGWTHSPWLWLQLFFSGAAVLTFSFFIYFFLRQPAMLNEKVRLRTRELCLKNEALEQQMLLRRQVEDELKTHRSALESQVAQRTFELKQRNMELRQALEELKASQLMLVQREKMASIGQLAAGVAHEINNPMGFITSNLNSMHRHQLKIRDFIHLQSQTLEEADPARAEALGRQRKAMKLDYLLGDTEDLIDESLEGTERVQKIVQGLKTFSRLDEAKQQEIDLNECIESSLQIAWNEIKYKASLHKELGALPPLLCNPQQLGQVFLNILVNAAQAIEQQGEIRLRSWREEQSLYVSIADTGCGIPEEHLGRLFEPFFTTKKTGEGTGLGMSISMDIVKKHGGDIQVKSRPGEGTEFIVRLPLSQPSPDASASL